MMKHLNTKLLLVCLLMGFLYPNLKSQCNFTIDVPQDITICDPSSINLQGAVNGVYLSYEWNGSNGYYNNSSLNVNDYVINTTTYTLSAFGESNTNLIVNGDFESGNNGFTSDYIFSNPPITCTNGNHVYGALGCEGTYRITKNPRNQHTNFAPCGDHTTGNGRMMAINGASTLQDVWCQTVSVTPGQDYVFRTWIASIEPTSPAMLQFRIDGVLIGNTFNASSTTCLWEEFYAVWNSGSSSSVEICIANQNFSGSGNDFAIDDIFFGELCEEEEEVTVTLSDIDLFIIPDGDLDCINTTQQVTSSSNTGNLSYDWYTTDGSITSTTSGPDITVDAPGNYTLVVTDMNGCTSSETAWVDGDTNPTSGLVINSDELDCSGDPVVVEVLPDESNVDILWEGADGPADGLFATYSAPGTYYVYITNDRNCLDSIPFEIIENIIAPDVNILQNENIRCASDTSTIIIEPTVSYTGLEWSNSEGTVLGQGTSLDVNSAGTYTYQFEYGAGCLYTDSIDVVSLVTPVDYDIVYDDTINCRARQVDLMVNIDSTILSTWSTDSILLSTNNEITVSEAGVYQLLLTDTNGCTYYDSVEIYEDLLVPTADFLIDSIDCINQEGWINLMTDSTNQVTWQSSLPFTVRGDTLLSQEPGVYTAILAGANYCEDTLSFSIPSSEDFPSVEITSSDIDCQNKSVDMIAESSIANSAYVWTLPDNTTIDNDAFTTDQAGTYELLVTAPNGCMQTASRTVEIDTLHPIVNLNGDLLTCMTTSINLQASIDGAYAQSYWEGEQLTEMSDSLATTSTPGWYALTVVGDNACIGKDSVLVLQDIDAPIVDALADDTLTCRQREINIIATSPDGADLQWFDSNNNPISSAADITIQSPGTYVIEGILARNGCVSYDTINIEIDTVRPSFQVSYNDINCIDTIADIRLDIDGNYSSIQYTGLTAISETQFQSQDAGAYNISVIAVNGCIREEGFQISIDTTPVVITTANDTLPCTGESIDLLAGVDLNTALVSWNGPNGFNSNVLEARTDVAGNYQITALNPDNGCESRSTLDIYPNETFITFETEALQPVCAGDPAYATISNISGSTAPYNITLLNENGQIVPDITAPLEPGIYIAEVTDRDNCLQNDTIVIEDRTPIDIDVFGDLSIAQGTDGSIYLETNLIDDLVQSIVWTPSNNLDCINCYNPLIESLEETTTYTVTLTDIYGCQVTDSLTIRVEIDIDFVVPNVFTPDGSGANDQFTIYTNRPNLIATIDQLLIYDRWGALVFKKNNFPINDPSQGWNGLYQGQLVTTGVYTYYGLVTLPDGKKKKFLGDVTRL